MRLSVLASVLFAAMAMSGMESIADYVGDAAADEIQLRCPIPSLQISNHDNGRARRKAVSPSLRPGFAQDRTG